MSIRPIRVVDVLNQTSRPRSSGFPRLADIDHAEKCLGVLKVLAATKDKAEGVKRVVSAIAQGTESIIEAFGGKSPTMGGQKETNILGETFFSQVPILYGDYVAKYSIGRKRDLLDAEIKIHAMKTIATIYWNRFCHQTPQYEGTST